MDGMQALPMELKMKTHPDGGWGWLVVMAAYLTQFIVVGLQNSFGVIFNELVEEFDESKGKTAWIGSMAMGIMFIVGPLTTVLCDKYGCRIVSFSGGIICAGGLIASSFTVDLQNMFITYGTVWGIGTSFCYFPTMITLVPWFEHRLALVNGIVSSGSGFGTLILSPFLQWFIHHYGLQSTFYLLAAMHGLVAVSSLAYRPVSPYYQDLQEKEHARLMRFVSTSSSGKVPLFREKAYIVWCVGLSIFMLGYYVPFVHLVRYAKVVGIGEHKAAFLIGVLSIVATTCKILVGKIAGLRCVNQLMMYQFGLLIMGIANTMLPVSNNYAALVAYAVVFGVSESCFIVMIPLLTKNIVGSKRLPRALGVLFALMGVPTMLGPPIAGWIYDMLEVYAYAFYLAGAMNTLGVLIMFLILVFQESRYSATCHDITTRHLLTSSPESEQSDTGWDVTCTDIKPEEQDVCSDCPVDVSCKRLPPPKYKLNIASDMCYTKTMETLHQPHGHYVVMERLSVL